MSFETLLSPCHVLFPSRVAVRNFPYVVNRRCSMPMRHSMSTISLLLHFALVTLLLCLIDDIPLPMSLRRVCVSCCASCIFCVFNCEHCSYCDRAFVGKPTSSSLLAEDVAVMAGGPWASQRWLNPHHREVLAEAFLVKIVLIPCVERESFQRTVRLNRCNERLYGTVPEAILNEEILKHALMKRWDLPQNGSEEPSLQDKVARICLTYV